jgi:hypothetical protein
MNELKVLESKLETATAIPAVIDFPIEEVRTFLVDYMQRYENVQYNDDMIKQIKADKTELNKIKKAINQFGINVEKELTKNVKDFRAELKELIALIDQPMVKIETEIAAFEEDRKKKKHEMVMAVVNRQLNDCQLLDMFKQRFEIKQQYYNVSMSLNKINDDVVAQLKVLLAEQDSYLAKCDQLDQYAELVSVKQGLNINLKSEAYKAMLFSKDLDEIKLLIDKDAEHQSKTEKEFVAKAQAAATEKAEKEAVQMINNVVDSIAAYTPVEAVDKKAELKDVTLKISATREQMEALKNWLLASGIKFERVI